MEKAKTEEKMYAEQLESLKKQFQTEQEASRKAACQESAEVRRDRIKRFQRLISRERGLLYNFPTEQEQLMTNTCLLFHSLWSCPSLVPKKQNFVMWWTDILVAMHSDYLWSL